MTIEKASRAFSDTSREKMADRGTAMPDGSYPIPDKDALRRAVASFGRAKDPAAVKRHIIKRARALGATDMLPADWTGSTKEKGSMAAQHSAQAADILEDLYCLIDCESDEPAHVAMLTQAADIVLRFVQAEHAEIGQPGDETDDEMPGKSKSFVEMKAEDLNTTELDRWLAGQRSRRILVVPFSGPLPGGKAGLDLDGEYFDADTDLYGRYATLRATRERFVDWHHDQDPTGLMKGAILGKIVLDADPEDDGLWADFWADAGEKRRKLVAELEKRGVPLYGSSQAARGVRKADDGHILVWPLIRHTITTSPQNLHAVVPPLKAMLTADLPFDEVGVEALRVAMLGLEDHLGSHGSDLFATSRRKADSKRTAKALRQEMDRLAQNLQTRSH